MRARINASMEKAAYGESIPEEKLIEWLYDWGLYDEDSLEDWIIWRRSNYVVLPYAGSWRDQPHWVRKDFLTLDLVRDYYDKQVGKPGTSSAVDPYEMFTEK